MKVLRNTKLLYMVVFATMFNLFTPIEVIYLKNMGISISIISILNLLIPVTCAVMEIPTGVLGDYLGRKKILLLSQFTYLASTVLLFFASEVYQFFIVFILEGLGWSFFSGNNDAILVEDAIEKKVGIGKQLAVFYSGLTLSSVIAGICNSFIEGFNQTSNFKTLILVSLIARIVAIPIAMKVKINSENVENKSKDKLPLKLLINSFNLIKSSNFSISVIIYESTGRLTFYLPVIIQPLLQKNGIELFYFGIIYTFSHIITYFSQSRVDEIVKSLGMKLILKFSPIIMSASLLLLLVSNKFFIILCLVTIQAISPIRQQCLNLQKNELASNDIRSTYLSTVSFCVLLTNSAILSVTGMILDKYFAVGIASLAIGCLCGGTFFYREILNLGNNNHRNIPNTVNLSVDEKEMD